MTDVTLSFVEAGAVTSPGWARSEGLSPTIGRLRCLVAVLHHPREGIVLFQTGLPHRGGKTLAQRCSSYLYAAAQGVHLPADNASTHHQLEAAGVLPASVRRIVLSHFHPECIGGCSDFPKADFVYTREAYEAVAHRSPLHALRDAFFPGLLPDDFGARSHPLSLAKDFVSPLPNAWPYLRGHDLFGDQTAFAVPLPGYATGHMGLLVQTKEGRRYFLTGEACITGGESDSPSTSRLVAMAFRGNADPDAYETTLERLRVFKATWPETRIVPSLFAGDPRSLPWLPRLAGELPRGDRFKGLRRLIPMVR